MKFTKNKLIFLVVALFCVLSAEIFLRSYYGFCHTVLFKGDPDFEYIPKPNQDLIRFRNHSKYNAESMRSDAIDRSSYKILGFGDSVINGGVLTDQDSLATSMLSDSLSKLKHKKVQFLNISAGSWGPDNCYAYLRKYGDFGAKSIFLFVSSHDAYDNMDFQKVVDVHENYPSKQYILALSELTNRYLLPRAYSYFKETIPKEENLLISKKKPNSVFNTGFNSFFEYTKNKKIPFTIVLHADKSELKEGAYNEQGQEIIKFAKKNNIDLIMDLNNGLNANCFRDEIHLNSIGQKNIARIVLLKGNVNAF